MGYFDVKIKRLNEDEREVKELYLVQAETCGEAETITALHLHIAALDVLKSEQSAIVEHTTVGVVPDKFYKAKYIRTYLTEDGKEKTSAWHTLLFADSFKTASVGALGMAEQYGDMVLVGLNLAKYVDVIE